VFTEDRHPCDSSFEEKTTYFAIFVFYPLAVLPMSTGSHARW